MSHESICSVSGSAKTLTMNFRSHIEEVASKFAILFFSTLMMRQAGSLTSLNPDEVAAFDLAGDKV